MSCGFGCFKSSFWECEGAFCGVLGVVFCVAVEHMKIACDPRRESWRWYERSDLLNVGYLVFLRC